MANPQLENGHTRIANELLEALCRTNLWPYESRVLIALIRFTYGWNKKNDWITLKQFSNLTGLDRRNVHRALKRLISKRIISAKRKGRRALIYGLQKDWEKWVLSSGPMSTAVVRSNDKMSSGPMTAVVNRDDGLSSAEMNTKDKIEIFTKEIHPNKEDAPPYDQIIEHFNLKTGKHFSKKSKTTRSHIQARWREGFQFDDFKTVINGRCAKWLNDPNMREYLRPQTLFGTKFESYLNDVTPPLAGKVSKTTLRNLQNVKEWSPPSERNM
jgi:phage replication O-like protein O